MTSAAAAQLLQPVSRTHRSSPRWCVALPGVPMLLVCDIIGPMEEKRDNTIQLRANRLRYWLVCGLFPLILCPVAEWISGLYVSVYVWMLVGWNLAILLRIATGRVRAHDILLTDVSIRGPVRLSRLQHCDSLSVNLEEIDLTNSEESLFLGRQLKLRNGRFLVLSTAFFPENRIQNLFKEIQHRASTHLRESAPLADVRPGSAGHLPGEESEE